MIKVAPSILSADFSKLGEEVGRLQTEGADWVHIDVMDGVFVPNITIGPIVVQHLRKYSQLPFDVHLMIMDPERYIERFSSTGADIITVHVEATKDIEMALKKIHDLGKKAGLSLNPETPFRTVEPFLDDVDVLLVMTVHPGFGGQSFMPECVQKIQSARTTIDDQGLKMDIEVDGGINTDTAAICVDSGATVLVAGSSLFKLSCMKDEIASWKRYSMSK